MPASQFFPKLELTEDGLAVGGPFKLEGVTPIGKVTVRWLLVKTTHAPGGGPPQRTVIEGHGELIPGTKEWRADPVKRDDVPADMRGRIRGIGYAVLVRPGEDGAPPAFDAFSWCAETEIVDDGETSEPAA
jgi:hypothetical protein